MGFDYPLLRMVAKFAYEVTQIFEAAPMHIPPLPLHCLSSGVVGVQGEGARDIDIQSALIFRPPRSSSANSFSTHFSLPPRAITNDKPTEVPIPKKLSSRSTSSAGPSQMIQASYTHSLLTCLSRKRGFIAFYAVSRARELHPHNQLEPVNPLPRARPAFRLSRVLVRNQRNLLRNAKCKIRRMYTILSGCAGKETWNWNWKCAQLVRKIDPDETRRGRGDGAPGGAPVRQFSSEVNEMDYYSDSDSHPDELLDVYACEASQLSPVYACEQIAWVVVCFEVEEPGIGWDFKARPIPEECRLWFI
ncbi:hypothetical protein B0H13DRAFT_1890916 [Mycena leptocephala]|nr:hypothetical protein B0H13DRAFT_1890916 [Mycena leptocephala]